MKCRKIKACWKSIIKKVNPRHGIPLYSVSCSKCIHHSFGDFSNTGRVDICFFRKYSYWKFDIITGAKTLRSRTNCADVNKKGNCPYFSFKDNS
jgi:hypothetical protein